MANYHTFITIRWRGVHYALHYIYDMQHATVLFDLSKHRLDTTNELPESFHDTEFYCTFLNAIVIQIKIYWHCVGLQFTCR